MAMSDCVKCWNTPCQCGWDYRNMKNDARIKQAAVVLGVDAEKLKEAIGDSIPSDHPMKEEA